MLPLGDFCRAHGIKGEIRLSTNLSPKFFSEVSVVFFGGKEYSVESIRAVNGGALIKLKGVDTLENADSLRGTAYLPDAFRPKLDADEFFWDDVIGLECALSDGKKIGKVTDVGLNAPTPVITVFSESRSGASTKNGGLRAGNEILFPVVKGLIKEVSPETGTLLLDAEVFGKVAVYED